MRHYITFSLCDETGEADLTPKSKETIEELIGDGLIAADWFGDIFHIADTLYDRAMFGMRERARERVVAMRGEGEARALGWYDHLMNDNEAVALETD